MIIKKTSIQYVFEFFPSSSRYTFSRAMVTEGFFKNLFANCRSRVGPSTLLNPVNNIDRLARTPLVVSGCDALQPFFQILTLTSISSRDLRSISAWKLSLAKQFFHMASFWEFYTWKSLKQKLLRETRFSFVTSNR